MVSEYYGAQKADPTRDEQIEFFERVETSLIDPDGPETHEIMRFTDEAGETNAVVVAYWLDATRHARWSQAAGHRRNRLPHPSECFHAAAAPTRAVKRARSPRKKTSGLLAEKPKVLWCF
jgi:hypothetical protein